jgi:predicted DCC family thiol-disulfide oxidoreductase YuxK
MTMDRPVLLYDGDCRFCRASARAVAALDRRRSFAILPLDDPAAAPLLASVPPERRGESMSVVQPDGWVLSAGDALIELTRVLPGGELLASAAWRNQGLRRLFGRGYRLVAGRRALLSRVIPDGPKPVRRPTSAEQRGVG